MSGIIFKSDDQKHVGKAKDLKTSSTQERIIIKINFGEFGEVPMSFIVEKDDLELAKSQVTDTTFGIYDVIREIGLEYIFAMRSYIEDIEKALTYDRIEYVEVAGQKIGAIEFHKRLKLKEESLIRGNYKYEYGSMADKLGKK